MRRQRTYLLLAAVAAFASLVDLAQAQTCKGNAGIAIARAYAIAVSYPDSVPAFVQENPSFFQPDGAAIACGRELSSRLMAAALSRPSRDSVEKQATDIACRAGKCELGGPVANDMLKTDLLQVAAYIENLAETSPALVTGNLEPYHGTAVYRTMQFVWQTLETSGLLPPQNVKVYRNITLQMSEWYLGNFVALMP